MSAMTHGFRARRKLDGTWVATKVTIDGQPFGPKYTGDSDEEALRKAMGADEKSKALLIGSGVVLASGALWWLYRSLAGK